MFLQNTHQFKMAIIVTTARQGTFDIPSIYFLNLILGGIYLSQVLSGIMTFIITIYFVNKNLRLMKYL